jgi:hypothetical protein
VQEAEATTTPGRAIVTSGWIANALFVITALPAAILDNEVVDDVAIALAVALFLWAVGAFIYAFAVGLARSARGDNVAVSNLFFLAGSAPRSVQRTFALMFVVSLVVAASTAAWEPLGVLVPMLPLGLAGVWAARYGTFPPRTPTRRRV